MAVEFWVALAVAVVGGGASPAGSVLKIGESTSG